MEVIVFRSPLSLSTNPHTIVHPSSYSGAWLCLVPMSEPAFSLRHGGNWAYKSKKTTQTCTCELDNVRKAKWKCAVVGSGHKERRLGRQANRAGVG